MENDEKLKKLEEIKNKLKALPDGWMNGEGTAYDTEKIDEFFKIFEENYILEEIPGIFPTVDGKLSIEWKKYEWDIYITVNLDDFTAEWDVIRIIDINDNPTKVLNLKKSESWKMFIDDFVSRI